MMIYMRVVAVSCIRDVAVPWSVVRGPGRGVGALACEPGFLSDRHDTNQTWHGFYWLVIDICIWFLKHD